jgi:hypothetical protein
MSLNTIGVEYAAPVRSNNFQTNQCIYEVSHVKQEQSTMKIVTIHVL